MSSVSRRGRIEPARSHGCRGAQPAFERAKSEDKPILLSISAVWCHWCHVMDETSYSDQGVIEAINRNFVPIRVDNDRRPDVNARYNMGGWPTTAFLAPDGTHADRRNLSAAAAVPRARSTKSRASMPNGRMRSRNTSPT